MIARILVGLVFIIFGVLFGGFLVGWGLHMVGSTALTCQRVASDQVNCTITEYRWLGLSYKATELTQVEEAKRESYSCGRNKRYTCYDLVIQTKYGNVEPTNLLSDLLVDEMNQFLASGQPTWTYRSWLVESLLGIAFVVVGGVMGVLPIRAGLMMLFGE